MLQRTRTAGIVAVVVVSTMCALPVISVGAAQTIYPSKDGTLADGGVFGTFDGAADDADWYFNQSSYEGAITLSVSTSGAGQENRVVGEYDLTSVTFTPPVSATLSVTLRGAPIWPIKNIVVHVYSYPADLQETFDDFASGPTAFQGSATVAHYQTPTQYSFDVGTVVTDALISGDDKVAFRFQIDPDTPENANQVFIDALESDPLTKPYLTIDEGVAIPGDADADGDVDLSDYATFLGCMSGPDLPADPGCETLDLDPDTDVDLLDFRLFQAHFTGQIF
ncbi:MAG TPA: hypothetical protein VM243_08175 [Phycisphaerae bacterium]|nr:hypothetical protein [Phycisphaerae bacterium]